MAITRVMSGLVSILLGFCLVGNVAFAGHPPLAPRPSRQVQEPLDVQAARKVSRLLFQDDRYVYLVDIRSSDFLVSLAQNGPKQLGMCIKGAAVGLFNAGRELCYLAADVVGGAIIGGRIALGVETAKDEAQFFVFRSGLMNAIRDQGLRAIVVQIPRGIFESTLGNLLSGDPEKAGEFITNTMLFVAPLPKAIQSIRSASNAVRLTGGQMMAAMNSPVLQAMPAGAAVAVEIDSVALAAAARSLVGASAVPVGVALMEAGGTATGRQFWGKWDCKSCGTKGISAKPANDGQVHCSNCGSPMPEDTDFYMDEAKDARGKVVSDKNLVDDSNAVEKKISKGGKDWGCKYCNARNRAAAKSCQGCGAAREADSTLAVDKPHTHSEASGLSGSSSPRSGMSPAKIGAIVAGGATVVGGTAYYLLKTEDVDGSVSGMNWKHVSNLERFTEVSRSDWEKNVRVSSPVMPRNGSGEYAGAFNVRNRRQEISHYVKVACGTEEEAYTEQEQDGYDTSYSNNGNGSFTEHQTPRYKSVTKYRTVTKYCDDPVYETKCDYDTYEWRSVDSHVLTGGEPKDKRSALPYPDNFSMGSNDRITHSEAYGVDIDYTYHDKRSVYNVVPKTESEFKSWSLGERLKLKVARVGVRQVIRNGQSSQY